MLHNLKHLKSWKNHKKKSLNKNKLPKETITGKWEVKLTPTQLITNKAVFDLKVHS
jgi:acyl CoA:acetate/3-ketoacid CoA transferase beta subunit